MDMIPDWAAHFLSTDQAYIAPYAYRLFTVVSTLKSWLLPLIEQATQKPDLASIALLLIVLYLSIKIVGLVLSSLFGWIRLAFRLAFWAGLTALGMWMWSRGPEGVMEDCQHWANVWSKEYGYWKDKERLAAMAGKGGFQVGNGGAPPRQTGYGSWF